MVTVKFKKVKAQQGLYDDIAKYIVSFEQYLPKPKIIGNERTYTVGYGNKYVNGQPVTDPNFSYTPQQAKKWLYGTIAENNELINKYVTAPLSKYKRIALHDFLYNVGSTQFLTSRLLQKINNQRPDSEISKEWNKWVYAEGNKFSPTLQARRQHNVSLFYNDDVYRENNLPVQSDNTRVVKPVNNFVTWKFSKENSDWKSPENPFRAKLKKGGVLTRQKAAEMLHDGTAHGKPITEQQRKFFGAVASGKKIKVKSNKY